MSVVQPLIFNLATMLIPLILAVAIHEWAHVAMARFLGDRTGENMGRLTLNPLAHADPIWTVGVPAFIIISQTLAQSAFPIPFFAAGKPAPFNPMNLTRKLFARRVTLRTGELLVAAAGPASNLVLAVVTAIVFTVAYKTEALEWESPICHLLVSFIALNLSLFVFNLVPIAPLDGSRVLRGILPTKQANQYAELSDRLSWLMLAALFVFGGRVLGPLNHFLLWSLISVLT